MKYIITDIKRQMRNKNRYNLYGEEGFFTSLSSETILKYNLTVDMEIDKAFLDRLRQEDTVKYAKELSIGYVCYSPRTRFQVEKHLAEKGIDKQSIAAAVAMLVEYGYINDAAYVEEFVRSYGNKLGERAMRLKLLERGVTRDVIDESLCVSPEAEVGTATEIAGKLMQRYLALPSQKRRQKVYAALLRRGFESDVIKQALGEGEEDD